MATAGIIGAFVKPETVGGLDIWARLEQEPIADAAGEATIADLHQMIAAAVSGKSAFSYVYDKCRYVTIKDGVITITLPFYVWPSSLDLDYVLSASLGTVSAAVSLEEHRSFDLVFDHTVSVDCKFLFTGTFDPEMPFFNDDGSKATVSSDDITVAGTQVFLPLPLTTVLRATGIARGWRHELVIEIAKAGTAYDPEATDDTERRDYKVDAPQSAVTVSWADENGASQSDIIDMQIPGCVEDLLAMCLEDATPKGDPDDDNGGMFVLYYSTCTGLPVGGRWEDR